MILKTNSKEVELLKFIPGSDIHMTTTIPTELGDTIEVYTTIQNEKNGEDPFLLASYSVADWSRVIVDGCNITLTNRPEAQPAESEEKQSMTIEEAILDKLAELDYRVGIMELGTDQEGEMV